MNPEVIEDAQEPIPALGAPELISVQSDELEQYFDQPEINVSAPRNALDIAFPIESLNYKDFVDRNNSVCPLSVVDLQCNPPLFENQEIILIREEFGQTICNRAFVSTTDHMIPHVDDGTVTITTTNDARKMFSNGFLMHVNKESYELFCFIPFGNGKKLYATGKVIRDGDYAYITQFFSVGLCSVDEPLPNIVITEDMEPRPLTDKLVDKDRIWCSKASVRFQKMFDEWDTVRDALITLNQLLYSTVDPNYMKKILFLNNQLSFPPFQIDK